MKTLQNNFTTPEQSKRLLELGVQANSADCIRVIATNMVLFIQEGRNAEYYIDKYNNERNVKAEPCWSVGWLIEIYEICSGIKFEHAYDGSNIMQDAFDTIYYLQNILDFSKLKK